MNSKVSKIDHLRVDYKKQSLQINEVLDNPFLQFNKWFKEALDSEILEPNAMVLSTVNKDGAPSSRILLIKEITSKGLIFYTNFNSSKGNDIKFNPKVAINFCWLPLERQIRWEGIAEKISKEKATKYFQSRPKNSQIGAWSSPQSQIIKSRLVLDDSKKELMKKYDLDSVLPKPDHWGGYLIKPTKVEFWQGRPNRLHDRIVYQKVDKLWKIYRLAP